jgi:hypothetical protein
MGWVESGEEQANPEFHFETLQHCGNSALGMK